MQYQSLKSNLAFFTLKSMELVSDASFTNCLESLMLMSSIPFQHHMNCKNDTSAGRPFLSTPGSVELNWSPKFSLQDGMEQLLTWHIDQYLPFGPSKTRYKLLNQMGTQVSENPENSLCDPYDIYCLRGRLVFPCSSECSNPNLCISTAFDRSAQISRKISENCETVLYSAYLFHHTTQLDVSAPPQDDNNSICSIAFILESSILANKLNISSMDNNNSNNFVSHEGWYIVPVGLKEEHISWDLYHLLKLSPTKFFHSAVKAALYIPPSFSTNPNTDDIIFTTGLLHRPLTTYSNPRIIRQMEQMHYIVGQSKRDALIVLPGAVIGENPDVQKVLSGSYPTKSQLLSAERGMRSMVEQQLWNDDESTRNRLEFEKDIVNIFNNHDFEVPSNIDSYKFSHRHWTRNHWVVHNFEENEAQQLRCDWYSEQMKWQDSNDNISFAHIMARMEIMRFNSLANDAEKSLMLERQASKDIDMESDEYQWSAVKDRYSNTDSYVRIVDDRALMIERRLWEIRKDLKNAGMA